MTGDPRSIALFSRKNVLGRVQPLHARVMGREYEQLSHALRSIHDVFDERQASGRSTVEIGSNWFSRLVVRNMGLPPSGDYDLHVDFREIDGTECWTRCFGPHCFRSLLRDGGPGRLIETLGPLSLTYHLAWDGNILTIAVHRWSLGPIPLPRSIRPRSIAREWEEGGLFHFDVPIDLPIIGRIVRYRGWLKP